MRVLHRLQLAMWIVNLPNETVIYLYLRKLDMAVLMKRLAMRIVNLSMGNVIKSKGYLAGNCQ